LRRGLAVCAFATFFGRWRFAAADWAKRFAFAALRACAVPYAGKPPAAAPSARATTYVPRSPQFLPSSRFRYHCAVPLERVPFWTFRLPFVLQTTPRKPTGCTTFTLSRWLPHTYLVSLYGEGVGLAFAARHMRTSRRILARARGAAALPYRLQAFVRYH